MKIIKNLSDRFEQLAPYQVIVLEFLFYVVLGVFFISLPFAQKMDNCIVNNLFIVVSAMSVLILAMVIGASPSGTGGGIKTTGVSALIGVVASVMRRHPEHITLLKRHIPLNRVFTAVAAAFTYLSFLGISVYFLCLTEHFSFMELCFEASSALGTVGLSMGITSGLTWIGKLIITATMFFGRVGSRPLVLHSLNQALMLFLKNQI